MTFLMSFLIAAGFGAAYLVYDELENDDDNDGDVDETNLPNSDEAVDDIDITDLIYDADDHQELGREPTIILNDEILEPVSEQDGTPSYDLSGVDVENDRIAVLMPSDYDLLSQTNFHLSLTDDGDVQLGGQFRDVVLEGLQEVPEGLMEVHFVTYNFSNTGDDPNALGEDEILASYEVVGAAFGAQSDDGYVADAGLELISLDDLEGDNSVIVAGDTALHVLFGDGSDTVDMSADAANGVTPPEIYEFASNEYGFEAQDTDRYRTPNPDLSHVDTGVGDDDITLGARATVVNSGAGSDHITASTDTSAYIYAEQGDDLIDLRAAGASSHILVLGGEGSDTFLGSAGDDTYFGGRTDVPDSGDIIYGLDGNDALMGGVGLDVIYGGEGNDTLGGNRSFFVSPPSGGSGFPWIDATSYDDGAADTLIGGAGNDVLRGDAQDVMTGGSGRDSFEVYWEPNVGAANEHAVVTDFEVGVDHLHITVHVDDFVGFWLEDEIPFDLTEVDGNTQVSLQGQMLVELQGVTGVSSSDIDGDVFVPYSRW